MVNVRTFVGRIFAEVWTLKPTLRALIGGISLGPSAYLGAAVTIVLIAVLIAATARITVRRTLLAGVE